jgi:phosphatidate cytidylyltransferase
MSDWNERHPPDPDDASEGVRIIGPHEPVGPQRRSPRPRPEPDPSHPSPEPEEGPSAEPAEEPHDEEVSTMSRRDPYERDEAAAWGTFAGAEPRWRGDEQVYAEPPAGRAVFGAEAPPGAETYEDAYSEQVDDGGYAAGAYEGRRGYRAGYADQSYADQGPDPRAMGAPPQYPDTYDDDGYDDDVYREAPAGYAPPPPPPPVGGRRARGRRTAGGGGERDLRMAVLVGLALAGLALILFKVGPTATMILVVAVLGMAAFEYFTATQRAGFDPLLPVGVVAAVSAPLAAYNYGESGLLLVLVLSVAVCTVWYLIGAGGERPMANIGATLLGICWVGLFGGFAGLLLAGAGSPDGIAFLLAALVPTIGYDVGALFVGRSAGSRPLSAASPNKTVEGLVGGMVLAVVGGLVLGLLKVDPFSSITEGLTVGLVAAVAAPLGDLSESLIKRDLGIKDMGTVLPGHGGVLDRFDALLFVLPAIWYTLRVSDFFF